MNLAELSCLGECGADPMLIENFGIDAINETAEILDEAKVKMQFGAIQSIKQAFSADNKAAKEELAAAQRAYNKDDKAEAKKHIDTAIKSLEAARKEAEKIDDDGVLETMLIASVMSMVPGIGSFAYTIGFYYSWYCLRDQSSKGDEYSKIEPSRRKNFALEYFFGKYRRAGYSRATLLAGYDKLIDEAYNLKKRIDNM